MERKAITYVDGTHKVTFVKVPNVPGFTHKVLVDGHNVAWLSDSHRPSCQNAEFFAEKYGAEL